MSRTLSADLESSFKEKNTQRQSGMRPLTDYPASRPAPPVVLLVGGMGKRLRPVLGSMIPKPLAPLGNKPFLNLLLHQLRVQGFQHIVMCTGHGCDRIKNRFGNGYYTDIKIDYSLEPRPLGTAGAIKLAHDYISYAPEFVVMNGDSFLDLDICSLLDAHRSCKRTATLAVSHVGDASRYGTVQVLSSGRVIGFAEKTGLRAPGTINAGVYVFDRSIFEYIPAGWANFEQDVFPHIVEAGVFAVQEQGVFIDIGIPEDYFRAQVLYTELYDAASRYGSSQEAL